MPAQDREAMSKKWSAQIFGSAALLVRDVDFLKPPGTHLGLALEAVSGPFNALYMTLKVFFMFFQGFSRTFHGFHRGFHVFFACVPSFSSTISSSRREF